MHTPLQLKEALIKDLNGSTSRDLDMLYWCGAAALELIGKAGKPTQPSHVCSVIPNYDIIRYRP